jgi:hypothetical protein
LVGLEFAYNTVIRLAKTEDYNSRLLTKTYTTLIMSLVLGPSSHQSQFIASIAPRHVKLAFILDPLHIFPGI